MLRMGGANRGLVELLDMNFAENVKAHGLLPRDNLQWKIVLVQDKSFHWPYSAL